MRRELWCGCASTVPPSYTSAIPRARWCKARGVSPRARSIESKPSFTVGLLIRCPAMKRERIDKLLVERGLAQSRTKAQALVMAGAVLVDEQLVRKPSESFLPEASVRIKNADDPASRYVGRGGLKLEAALREFQIEVTGLTCLDVGASTGGFTDFLLQHGANKDVAVDVGGNQS